MVTSVATIMASCFFLKEIIGEKKHNVRMKEIEARLAHLVDLARMASRRGEITHSDFFGYSQWRSLGIEGDRFYGVDFILFGGEKGSERKAVFFLPPGESRENLSEDIFQEAISCFLVKARNEKYASPLTHSEVLGALMACGIKRETIGDIVAEGHQAKVFCLKAIESEVEALTSVGKTPIEVRRIEPSEIQVKNDGEEKRITVESLRLDAILSACFPLSREEAKRQIQAGNATLTGKSEPSPSDKVRIGDHIHLKHKGRIVIVFEEGQSKKGKTILFVRVSKVK